MDKLTLEVLAAYLPYEPKMQVKREDGSTDLITLNANKILLVLDGYYWGTEKLILRPMSDLTKDIEHKGQKFTPMTAISKRFDMNVVEHCFIEQNAPTNYRWIKTFRYDVVQTLISWHFDVFGLIEKGLAIDLNTVKGGPHEI
ncbi:MULTISPECIES: hypothetical protein [Sphingobacterium]|uniref:hypothetical protein n=1 Tax=Sphingobacterium TaxID=28453 RepID=UPI00257B44A4|nr:MULTISPECIES: hypothetical protein [Sphingobacterium]